MSSSPGLLGDPTVWVDQTISLNLDNVIKHKAQTPGGCSG